MPDFASHIDEAVNGTHLGSKFKQVAPCRWAHQRGDIRHVFEFQRIKRTSYSARWGVDFPICPVVQGTRLTSKKAPAKATADLVLDPIDVQGDLQPWHSVHEYDPAIGKLRAVAETATAKALIELEEIVDLPSLKLAFESRSMMSFARFGLTNYVQTNLCWGLVCYALGDHAAGQTHLDRFSETFDVPSDTPALTKAVSAAIALYETIQ